MNGYDMSLTQLVGITIYTTPLPLPTSSSSKHINFLFRWSPTLSLSASCILAGIVMLYICTSTPQLGDKFCNYNRIQIGMATDNVGSILTNGQHPTVSHPLS
jgi:hypothetical protein